ncbi:MAG: hypothetical protein J0L80_07190 [Chitinophagales bacterium]|nr:hypothetical protein [Chitinophagales bacterium]
MKSNKIIQYRRHQLARQRYQLKRSRKRYQQTRQKRIFRWLTKSDVKEIKKKDKTKTKNHVAPKNFSLINNTEKMLSYLHESRKIIKDRKPINLDISRITKMTPDSIALVISTITNPLWNHKTIVKGNAPKDIRLRKEFVESGFYNYVKSKIPVRSYENSLMHKETSKIVKPDIAGSAIDIILNKQQLNDDEIDAVYTIFIELMSNTLHHADMEKFAVSNWWLYVSNENGKTCVTFVDLGVGIFKSIHVRNYFKAIGKSLKLIKNVDYVEELLSGKIGSRIEKDNSIRGKGIPQIVKSSKLDCFKKFFIISNDVKIDLKNNIYEGLENKFRGTFFYFELCQTCNNTTNGN